MNRVIKFRVWDQDHSWGVMRDFELGELLIGNDNHSLDLDKYAVMQFTGIADKLKTDIYEFDILSTNVNYNGRTAKYIVCYVTGAFRLLRFTKDHNPFEDRFNLADLQWFINHQNNEADLEEPWGMWSLLSTISNEEKLKIVGNVFETPELIKK